jgi:hypothetical protein
MYRVPPARAWWPAVGAPLERGVRPQSAGCEQRDVFGLGLNFGGWQQTAVSGDHFLSLACSSTICLLSLPVSQALELMM